MIKPTFRINADAVKRVRARMAEIAKRAQGTAKHFSIGIHEADGAKPALNYQGNETATDLITVALVHEFGAGRMPDRSFLRTWFDANASRMRTQAAHAMRAEFKRGKEGEVMALAERWLAELRAWITETTGELAPLAPATEKVRVRAGLPPGPPLYAVGQLVEAIKLLARDES